MKIKKIGNHYEVRKMVNRKTYFLSFMSKPTKTDIQNQLLEKMQQSKKTDTEKTKDLKYYINEYLQNKNQVLSPSTLRGYHFISKTISTELLQLPLEKINTNTLQRYINQMATTKSVKTIKNHIGLILAVLNYNNIEKRYNLKYPQPIKRQPYIPNDNDIKRIDTELLHTKYYIFFRLCLYGLRVSEVLGLTINDIKENGELRINKAKVIDIKKEWRIKTTKTISSNRVIKIDKELAKKIINQNYVIDITYRQFYKYFTKTLTELHIKYFSPHKLRHYIASKMHSMNIPTKYIMEYGGWSNTQTLEKIYTHTNQSDKDKYYNLLNTELETIIK